MLASEDPTPWRVEIAPGDGDRWCANGAADRDPQAEGDPCNELIGPEGVARRDGLGPLSTYELPPRSFVAWGTTSREIDRVVAVMPDGRRIATMASFGPYPFVVWAVGLTEPPAKFEAMGPDGDRVAVRPVHPAPGW